MTSEDRGQVATMVAILCASGLATSSGGALWPLGVVALVAMGRSLWHGGGPVRWPPVLVAMASLAAVDAVTGTGAQSASSLTVVLMLAGVVVVLGSRWELTPPLQLAMLLVGVALIGTGAALGAPGSDVVALHQAAPDPVLQGATPFRDLGVVESNPYAYGQPIDGYPYPPVVLAVMALGGRLVGDPRVVTVLLWVAIVALAARRYGSASPAPAALALVPGVGSSVVLAWTEPLTALLVLGALSLGAGRGRAAMVGVAFASKQYLAFALPAVVAAWWHRRRWLLVAAASAVVVTLPVLVDLSGAFDALVGFHLDRPLRPDSSNLAGFLAGNRGWTAWPVPSVVVALVAGAAGAVVARRHGEIGWLPGTAVALAATLVIGPVSLVNYWILVTVLLLLVEGERSVAAVAPTADAAVRGRLGTG